MEQAVGQLTDTIKTRGGYYVLFIISLIVAEKYIENDFICPCRNDFQTWMFWLYLLVPCFVTFTITFYILYDPDNKTNPVARESDTRWVKNWKRFLKYGFPSLVWVSLFFISGKYLACYNSEWEGDYAESDQTYPWQWCSQNLTLTPGQENAQTLFYRSKIGGLIGLAMVTFAALTYKIWRQCFGQQETSLDRSGATRHRNPDEAGLIQNDE